MYFRVLDNHWKLLFKGRVKSLDHILDERYIRSIIRSVPYIEAICFWPAERDYEISSPPLLWYRRELGWRYLDPSTVFATKKYPGFNHITKPICGPREIESLLREYWTQ